MPVSIKSPTPTAVRLTLISLVALFIGHLFIRTYAVWFGLFIVPFFIYNFTLRKNDLFSFLMVIYFCGSFPYMTSEGGAFNMVSFVCIGFYYISKNRFPYENRMRDNWFKLFLGLIVIASVLGWIFNYTGTGLEFVYSFLSFFGIIFLLLVSSRLEITADRIKVFLQLNLVLIIYSTIASINTYLKIINFYTPMMPKYGSSSRYFEGGGIIGSSPLYGEHSLILLMLFLVFLIFNKHTVKIGRSTLFVAAIISFINVFMSISRSVFLLSAAGLALLFLFQAKLVKIRISKIFQQIIILSLISFFVLYIIQTTGINRVFERMEEIQTRNVKTGGFTVKGILDGSAINRSYSFEIGYNRYASKDSWIIGYGWGLEKNNRDAFYVDPKIKQGSAHSQIFAILFIFGWIGFIGYWGLILRIIFKAYKTVGYKNVDFIKRIMAFFFFISFCLFVFNEIKVDSISVPTYFSVTIIWMGMAYSTFYYKHSKTIHV